MKYTVIGIQHKCGTFTPTTGKDAGTEKEYDFPPPALHQEEPREHRRYGSRSFVAPPDMYGQLVAEKAGGHPEDILNRKIDFETKELYKVTSTSKILRLWSNEVQPNGNEPATTRPPP